ncbi:MAG TPA: threonine/serine dehydratase [Solirubrobacteraceae bacterium]|nr:threonine/serine dehydratase [Solirubrobacteraceae bacterium]
MPNAALPGLDECLQAAARLEGHIHRTPTLSSRSLGKIIGRPAFLKAELFQRTGAFKLRGAMNRVADLSAAERATGAVTVSAGNHAQAAALACAEAGVDVVVFMPHSASEMKVAATRGYGATVDLEAADGAEAFARMHDLAVRSGRIVIHPFDDPRVIAGASTVGLEICADIPSPGAVIVPASGGGLVSGVAIAVKALAPAARVVAVQPSATATLRASRSPERPSAAPAGSRRATIADALTAPGIGELNLAACAEHVDEVVHLDEEEIAAGVRFLYERAKLACEAGAAVGVGALLAGKVAELGEGPVVAVVSGGNLTPQLAASILSGG